ncbi:unnamed protein product [Pleuronectes platessa]|uniref:HAT C-terminal dimerisation domain-containing protein n=1 Tax=Pleuronectes platessa TaxID=8262 RepID=A0A9N7U7F0_PLEPL|nr:unnamed protein product [Pleuronectes platessa]
MNILGAFNIISPQAVEKGDDDFEENLQLLSQKCQVHVGQAIFKDKSQLEVMQELASDFVQLKLLYPNLAQLSAIALTIPVSSVNCERDFSAMNRIKIDLRNRLQGKA